MKKVLLILLVVGILAPQYAYAQNYEWTVTDKSITEGIDYSAKVGDYFFEFERKYISEKFSKVSFLLYSTDGINFVKTEYQTGAMPIYKTQDGVNLQKVSEDEDISFLSGKVLYNNDIPIYFFGYIEYGTV